MGSMHEIAVMDRTGDTKTIWDPNKPDEIEMAKQTFDRLKTKGYAIFTVGKNGQKDEVMHKFDPKAEKMIAVAPIAGG